MAEKQSIRLRSLFIITMMCVCCGFECPAQKPDADKSQPPGAPLFQDITSGKQSAVPSDPQPAEPAPAQLTTPTPKPSPTPLTMSQLDALILPRGVPPDKSKYLALIYNGYRRSSIDPCGCVSHQLGGIDKEARINARLEEFKFPVMKVDAGGFVREAPSDVAILRTRYLMQALGRMKYDAVNVAYSDMDAGIKFLRDAAASNNLTLISANIVDGTSTPIFAPYRVVAAKLGDETEVKAGIIGVTRSRASTMLPPSAPTSGASGGAPPEFKPSTGASHDSFTIIDAAEALKKYLPELREKSDFIILLDYEMREATRRLIERLGSDCGIKYAVSGEWTGVFSDVLAAGQAQIVSGGYEGRQVGFYLIEFDGKKPVRSSNQFIEVVQSIPPAPEITSILDDARKAVLSTPSQVPPPNM